MEFKSQICTTIEQSKRLLELGLNPETADMRHIPYSEFSVPMKYNDGFFFDDSDYTPAWSLHRLMEIGDFVNVGFWRIEKMYECCIQMLEGQIRGGIINKEYINK